MPPKPEKNLTSFPAHTVAGTELDSAPWGRRFQIFFVCFHMVCPLPPFVALITSQVFFLATSSPRV